MENLAITKRQIKTKEIKHKLREAMQQIMEKYDYDTLTIRNICKVSGVSYGSFYNLFPTKEDFLRYYLTYDFVEYKNQYYKDNTRFEKLNDIEKSIDIFKCCAEYNVHKGVKFIAGFYSSHNTSLFPVNEEFGKECSFTPLLKEVRYYLERAKEAKLIPSNLDINKRSYEYCYIFNGITFNWCVSNGQLEMADLTEKLLSDLYK